MSKDDFDYAQLDSGIREIVRTLRERGWNTTDSGDGSSKPKEKREFDFPHVAVAVGGHQDLRRNAYVLAADLPAGWIVEATFSTKDKISLLFARLDA